MKFSFHLRFIYFLFFFCKQFLLCRGSHPTLIVSHLHNVQGKKTETGNWPPETLHVKLRKNMHPSVRPFERRLSFWLGVRSIDRSIYLLVFETMLLLNFQKSFCKNFPKIIINGIRWSFRRRGRKQQQHSIHVKIIDFNKSTGKKMELLWITFG